MMDQSNRPLATSDIAESHSQPTDSGKSMATSPTATATETAELTGRREGGEGALLGDEETSRFRGQWEKIQVSFVDTPREAVERADSLVAEVMKELATTFSRMRTELEAQWSSGAQVGTEELRVALQRYRAFFELLLRR